MPWGKNRSKAFVRRYNREEVRKWRAAHPEYRKRESKSDRKRRSELKYEVLLHYTETPHPNLRAGYPHCAKCPFSDIRALTLDKKEGGHTKSGLPYGVMLYQKLKKEGYPEGWQVLCMNCQWIKRYENKELTPPML